MTRLSLSLSLSLSLVALPCAAQAPDDLPPGHPPVADDLPPGHPPVADDLPPGHPQVADDDAPPADPHGHGGMGDAEADFSRAMAPPSVATGTETDALPAGSIRVTVVDTEGTPLPDAEVQLGIMRQGGDRDRTPGRTGADGVYTYTGLPTGVGQAYRVNVISDGATYSSTPFQLPPTRGYAVEIRRLPTTHDQRVLLMVVGQTYVEIHEERIHVVQEMQLSNLGAATYVFPDDGIALHLPEGFLAFQTQPVMTDQHVTEAEGLGARLTGSLPPGRVTLAYAYDLPITGSDMTFEVSLPIRVYIYRVIVDAPESLRLDVEGMPRAIRFEDQGRSLLGTEIQRQPGDAQLQHVLVTLHGIPGPGPVRWIALAAAVVMALGGVLAAARGPRKHAAMNDEKALARRRQQLLEELRALDAEYEAGEIGPAYRQSRRSVLVRSLAGVLHEEERAASGGKSG
jgi:hypothetical protein